MRAIDGTHKMTMILRRDMNNYHSRHGIICQNDLVTWNCDLKFVYILSGWEVQLMIQNSK